MPVIEFTRFLLFLEYISFSAMHLKEQNLLCLEALTFEYPKSADSLWAG
jgi:hypothetical protein